MKKIIQLLLFLSIGVKLMAQTCGSCIALNYESIQFPNGTGPFVNPGGTINVPYSQYTSSNKLRVEVSPHPYNSLNTGIWETYVEIFVNGSSIIPGISGANPYRHMNGNVASVRLIPITSFQTGSNTVCIKAKCSTSPSQCQLSCFTVIVAGPPCSATPNFTINSTAAVDNPTPVPLVTFLPTEVITIDASGTTCESNYWVGIWETTSNWWERTYQYEWGGWFQGQAPASINLQALAATSGDRWINGPAARKNNVLIGGKISGSATVSFNGQDRYYVVEVCTGEPTWTCKRIQIRILCQ